jgi:UDP:flavonoid glycosyltransferase YjiC (YdhE family)
LFTAASFTENNIQTWIKTNLEAARQVGKRALILGVPAEQETTSDQVMARHFAPLEAVLPRCALIAHQGGIGTTALALRAGTPMLICPGAHDQFDTARRATHLGVDRAEKLARELEALIQDAALKVRLAQWRDELQRHNGVVAASDAIESLL